MFCLDIFLTDLLGFTKTFMASESMASESMASESIAHSAFGLLAIESEPIRVRRIIVKYTFTEILRHIFFVKGFTVADHYSFSTCGNQQFPLSWKSFQFLLAKYQELHS